MKDYICAYCAKPLYSQAVMLGSKAVCLKCSERMMPRITVESAFTSLLSALINEQANPDIITDVEILKEKYLKDKQ